MRQPGELLVSIQSQANADMLLCSLTSLPSSVRRASNVRYSYLDAISLCHLEVTHGVTMKGCLLPSFAPHIKQQTCALSSTPWLKLNLCNGRSVQRYQHYFTRWEAHAKSAEAEGQQREKLQTKVGVLEQNKSMLKDYAWLLQVNTSTAMLKPSHNSGDSCLFRLMKAAVLAWRS